MRALVHIVLGDFRAVVEDLGGMGLLKPTIDKSQLAVDLSEEFEKMTGGGTGAVSTVSDL